MRFLIPFTALFLALGIACPATFRATSSARRLLLGEVAERGRAALAHRHVRRPQPAHLAGHGGVDEVARGGEAEDGLRLQRAGDGGDHGARLILGEERGQRGGGLRGRAAPAHAAGRGHKLTFTFTFTRSKKVKRALP